MEERIKLMSQPACAGSSEFLMKMLENATA